MPSPRPPRQATACQWCRAHKLKCDAEQPSCRNCARRSQLCITTDLRKPGAEGRRQPPVGRKRRSVITSPTVAAAQSKSAEPSSPLWLTQTTTALTDVAEYPPLPEQPSHRSFEPRSPDRLLPEVFATPFNQDPDVPVQLHGRQAAAGTVNTLHAGRTSSHHLLIQWLDLFFLQNPTWEPVFPHIKKGWAYTVEMPLPPLPWGVPSPAPPALPLPPVLERYTGLFFARIQPLYPLLDHEAFVSFSAYFGSRAAGTMNSLSVVDLTRLVSIYLVCSLAADEEVGSVSPLGTQYLETAYELYARFVAQPCLGSIQALLLLVIALRSRNKDAASWNVLGQAIRLAQSLCLHRDTDSSCDIGNDRHDGVSGDREVDSLGRRLWWVAYVLERNMELDTGWLPIIRDDECNVQVLPIRTNGLSVDYFSTLVRLARLKTGVARLLYARSGSSRSVRDLLFEMGHLDRALLDWADSFPEPVRPGRDLVCGGHELPLATYVALQYHQTLMALHRPALFSAPGFLRSRIRQYLAGTPMHDRLHFSLCIGAASARSVLKAANDLSMYAAVPGPGRLSRLVTADQLLLAVLILGVYVVKVPLSRLNHADLALVDTFGRLVEDEFAHTGQDPEFLRGLHLLRTQLGSSLSDLDRQSMTPEVNSCGSSHPTLVPALSEPEITPEQLEASWAHLWDGDFAKMLELPEGEYEACASANMYLLGITQSWPSLD